MSHFIHKKCYILLGSLVLVSGLCALFYFTAPRTRYEAAAMTENSEILNNPYCGFYHLYGYLLSEEGRKPARQWCENMLANDSQSILLLQINLRQYSNKSISSFALDQLDTILSTFSGADRQLIVRFLYDWDGNALQTEPASQDQILSHMKQVAPVVNRFSSHVFLLQGIFTGNCGEMNQTHYGDREHLSLFMETLASVTSPDIFLSVRTPQHLRTITGTRTPLDSSQAYTGTLPARLGLYNDGMLGDAYDCGTYDDTPFAGTSDPAEKGTRSEEIQFQNQLCLYVPNGGEAVLDNPYNDLDRAIQDLRQMHVSYLSADHEASVLDKWKASQYQGTSGDPFDGNSGYDYIAAHLGYRYVVRDSWVTGTKGFRPRPILHITLENTGFSPAYRPFDTKIFLQNTDSGEKISLPADFDNRTLLPDKPQTLSLPIDIKSVPEGIWQLSLSMTDQATGISIQFANGGQSSEKEVVCGQISIQ